MTCLLLPSLREGAPLDLQLLRVDKDKAYVSLAAGQIRTPSKEDSAAKQPTGMEALDAKGRRRVTQLVAGAERCSATHGKERSTHEAGQCFHAKPVVRLTPHETACSMPKVSTPHFPIDCP